TNDEIRRRRTRSVSLLEAAIAAIEACHHSRTPVAGGRLCVDESLHFIPPFLAFIGATDAAQIVQRAHDLSEPLQVGVEGRWRLPARGRAGHGQRKQYGKEDRAHRGPTASPDKSGHCRSQAV